MYSFDISFFDLLLYLMVHIVDEEIEFEVYIYVLFSLY